MAIRSLDDLELQDKRVLLRVDYNTPMKDGEVSDDARIRASLPTLKRLCDANCTVTLMSHLGRPKGHFDPDLSLKPIARCLANLLGRAVTMLDIDGDPPTEPGIGLLENLRFWPGEKQDDADFARRLARFGEVYVNDAFGAAHRAHASIHALAKLFEQRAAGLLLAKEVHYLRDQLGHAQRPFVAIMGGSKVSDKIRLIENLIPKVDQILIGGAMSYTFLKAKGVPVGLSRVETDFLTEAERLLQLAEDRGVQILLPLDHVTSSEFSDNAQATITLDEQIDEDQMGLDIGPETINLFATQIRAAQTVVWNGPMGVFEWDIFSTGTISIAEALAECRGLTVVGGGDSAAAIKKAEVEDQIDHISTGGGAALELLSGIELPGLRVLED